MTKHGASHGAAVLVCMVASVLLADIIKKYVPIIYNAVLKFSYLLADLFHLQVSTGYLSTLIYASMLAVIWGIAFSFVHED